MSAAADIDERLQEQESFAYRLWKSRVTIDGDAFEPSFAPYLLELYDQPHHNIVGMKGAQIGLTGWAVLTVIERMRRGMYPRGVIYGFPTQDEVFDFSQARFARMLRENATYFSGVVRETNRTELKQIGSAMLYFRGVRQPVHTKRPTKLLSIPADLLALDEYNDMDRNALAILMKRLDSSKVRHLMRFGHPSVPRWGISELYDESDQRRWLIKCRSCNAYTCLEDEFPNCLGQTDGNWFRCCARCRREIFVVDGQWVPLFPDRSKDCRGYWMSQLLSAVKPMNVIAAEYEKVCSTGKDEQAFWNLVIAKPYADENQVLTEENALAICNADRPLMHSHYGPSFGGFDVGGQKLYAWFGTHDPKLKKRHYHWVGELATFDELRDIGNKFNTRICVADAMAETRAVTDWIKRTPWAWGCRYDARIGKDWDWNADTRIVSVNRTASLDGSHRAITDGKVSVHRRSQYYERVVVPMLTNLVRIKTEDEHTGQVKFEWHVRGAKNDHFRHGFNYAEIASERVGVAVPPGKQNTAPVQHWQAV